MHVNNYDIIENVKIQLEKMDIVYDALSEVRSKDGISVYRVYCNGLYSENDCITHENLQYICSGKATPMLIFPMFHILLGTLQSSHFYKTACRYKNMPKWAIPYVEQIEKGTFSHAVERLISQWHFD